MTTPNNANNAYRVRAVIRVLDILDILQNSPSGVTLQEIQEAANLPKSSAFRYLSTLISRGYAQQDPSTNTYRLGSAFFPSYARHLELISARSKPLLEELRDRFGETINLGILDGTRVAYLQIVESPSSIRFSARPGDRDPIHSTALGKAVATYLADDEIQSILATEGMSRQTSNTITDPDIFIQEVAKVRNRGFAIDDGENEPAGRCVAVPILGSQIPMALSLSAPAVRFAMDDVELVAAHLKDTAARIAKVIGEPHLSRPS